MEKWKTIEINPEWSISNMGRVMKNGRIFSTKHSSGNAIAQAVYYIDGKQKALRVNKVVYTMFVGRYNSDNYFINHKDGDKYNCSLDNLQLEPKKEYLYRMSVTYKKWIRRQILNSGFKKCSKCKEYKDIVNFDWHTTLGRFRSACLTCQRKQATKRVNKYYKKRRKDPFFKLQFNFRQRTTLAIKSKGFTKKSKTQKILGCSWDKLKEHLENQFTDGMNWDNYGEWHVDHIIPISMSETEEQLYKLSHYTNLQPLWGEENLAKSDNLPKEQIEKAKSLGLTIDYSKVI